MDKGAHTDIQTNRPIASVDAERDNAAKSKLEQKAKLSSLSKTEAGAILISMIKKSLTARINVLIQNDPEAKAFNDMLNRVGATEVDGKKAAEELASRYFEPGKAPGV